MSQYIVLSKITVQNANSIAGLTWGFPAITSFLGFKHALNRKLSETHDIDLTGCAVISNSFNQHIYSDKNGIRFTQRKFGYTFKPKKKGGRQVDPSIIEEGKMNLTVSLVIEIKNSLLLTNEQRQDFEEQIEKICTHMRLAGGTILSIENVKLLSSSTTAEESEMLRKVKRLVMPGFVLLDKSHYLKEHYESRKRHEESVQLFDAWLDFSALRFKAIPKLKDGQQQPDETTPADWQYQPKPNKGYLVPLMTGYKAISELYEAGEVANTRDSETPTRFVEAIHSVGEWKGAHSIKNICDVIWRYQHQNDWYLCTQSKSTDIADNEPSDTLTNEQHVTLTEALNLL